MADLALSAQHLTPWFKDHGLNQVTLLENLRFSPGEQSKDPATKLAFAQQLAHNMDYYINDAFGTIHRNDTSITLLPTLFATENRFYGLCIAQEFQNLEQLRNAPAKPFIAVLGGNKLADKLPLIHHLITAPASTRVTHIMLGGALANAVLANPQHELQALATQHNVFLGLPTDGTDTDIGPATIASYQAIIATAQTIFANGTMGVYEQPDSQEGTKAILQAIANNKGFTVLGGGDCAAAAQQFGIADKVSFISTGGGATLAYLAAQEPWLELPGLAALN